MTPDSRRLEQRVETAAALSMAGACAFAVGALLVADGFGQSGAAASIATAGIMFFVTRELLDRVEPRAELRLPAFAQAAFPAEDGGDELLLTDRSTADNELLLDVVLEQPAADSRVVRLFERGAPTAATAAPDASETLRRALHDLRRSLR
jgi:hypothetical protein